jgi:predicted RNA-binding Zn-ribbon protein involved in translation (DUF1610 family)
MDKRPSPAREHAGDGSAEFQKRRRRAWRKVRWAVLALLVSFAAAWWDMRFFFIGFVASAGAIIWLTFVGTRHYRCPACGKLPMTNGPAFGTDGIWYDKSVDLDPEFCSNCGVRLKPEPEVERLLF